MRKVLIIEDDLVVANIYRNKLSLEGFNVETASDGQTGWELIQSMQPDGVLLDLMMPKLTGTELLRKARGDAQFKNLPIVVLSNTYLTSMVQDAWKAGATKVLSKSGCTPKQVIDIFQSCFTVAAPAPALASTAPVAAQTVASPSQTQAARHVPPTQVPSDEEFQGELQRVFFTSFPATLAGLRASLQVLTKAQGENARGEALDELHRKVRSLASSAGLAGVTAIAQMAAATEALLKELHDKPKNVNGSALRTIASAVDSLNLMLKPKHGTGEIGTRANVLVVDDEPVSRHAIRHALKRAGLNHISVDDSKAALSVLRDNKFDLIFLDVDMPELNGFEVCSQLRKMPGYAKTPVVFVTGLSDFESRAKSMISGGTDLIGKPFLSMELAVKALGYLMRGRLESAAEKPVEARPAPKDEA